MSKSVKTLKVEKSKSDNCHDKENSETKMNERDKTQILLFFFKKKKTREEKFFNWTPNENQR